MGVQPILLVEDDPDDALLAERAFRRTNVANPLRVVADGDEAVAYLAGEGRFADREANPLPVLVLLDLKLPRRSGFEVLEWLRAEPGLERLPVVVLTSSRETTDIDRAYELGANSYVVKPVDFASLMEIAHVLHIYWLIVNEPPRLES
jgi:CheY-like chemotaxis protein